jgi:hypothetical protein
MLEELQPNLYEEELARIVDIQLNRLSQRGGGKGARHQYGSSLFDGFPLTDRCGIKVRQASSSRQLQSGP